MSGDEVWCSSVRLFIGEFWQKFTSLSKQIGAEDDFGPRHRFHTLRNMSHMSGTDLTSTRLEWIKQVE